MADRTVAVTLTARTTGVVSGLKTAQTAAENFASKGLDRIGKSSHHISDLTNKTGALGLALVGAAGIAVKRFADFDQAMSGVAATGDDARKSLDALRDAAIQAGADTQFSATEAARGIESLEKAGVDAADILGGGLSGSLNLAAAGGLEVADAADAAATALTQFGLKGSDVNHVADLLAAGAGKAQGDVSDMAMALKQAGLVANQTGLSIEETTGGLAAFASAGLIGSDAGTSFKSMLQRLTPQSKEAQKAMDQLGISAYDSQGQFIGLEKFAGNLRDAMRNLSPEARNAAMSVIFGSDAVRAANVLYDNGAEGIQKWIDAVDDAGYASETARTKTDNLRGDIERLGGSLDTALIKGGSGANDTLRSLTQSAEVLVDKIGELPQPILTATVLLAGAGGLALLGVTAIGKLHVAITEAKVAMEALGLAANGAKLAIGGIGVVIGLATIGVAKWAQAQAETKQRITDITASLDQQTGAITENTRATVYKQLQDKGAIDTAKKLGLSLKDVVTAAIDPTSEAYKKLAGQVEALKKASGGKGLDLGDLGGTEKALDALNDYSTVLVAVNGRSEEVSESQQKVRDQLAAGIGTTDDATSAQSDLAGGLSSTTSALADQTDAYAELNKAQSDAAGLVLSVLDAQRGLEQATADATKSIEDNGASLDITTQAGRDNQAALTDVAKAGWGLVESMQANGATQEEIKGVLEDTRGRFLNLATGMGLSSDEANSLADELNLIPTNIQSKVVVTIQADVASAYNVVNSFIRDVSGRRILLNVEGQQVGIQGARGDYNANASGGQVTAGQSYWVGEHGPELWRATATGTVTNHSASRAMAAAESNRFVPSGLSSSSHGSTGGAGGGDVVFKVDNITTANPDAAAARLMTSARDAINAYGIESLGVFS